MKRIDIFTDGSVTNNGKKDSYGSFAFVILLEKNIIYEYSQFCTGITNNQMELNGLIYSLRFLLENNLYNNKVMLYSDSKYCVDGINWWVSGWKSRNWRRSDGKIPNSEYWRELDGIVSRFKDLTIRWVKGHDKNEWNNYVDNLCTLEVLKNGGISFEMQREGVTLESLNLI